MKSINNEENHKRHNNNAYVLEAVYNPHTNTVHLSRRPIWTIAQRKEKSDDNKVVKVLLSDALITTLHNDMLDRLMRSSGRHLRNGAVDLLDDLDSDFML